MEGLTVCVQPPLIEKEMIVFFVNTLKAPYYDKMVGNATKNFVDMVISREMIEGAIKGGKIESVDPWKKSGVKKNKGETYVVTYRD